MTILELERIAERIRKDVERIKAKCTPAQIEAVIVQQNAIVAHMNGLDLNARATTVLFLAVIVGLIDGMSQAARGEHGGDQS